MTAGEMGQAYAVAALSLGVVLVLLRIWRGMR
jgi:hypothetical protein